MKRIGVILAAAAAMIGMLPGTSQAAAIGEPVSGHSHWDIHNYADHNIKFCWTFMGKDSANATSMLFHIPHREVDSQNFMTLQAMTNGFRLTRRVAGVSTIVTPDPTVPNPNLDFSNLSAGTEIMADYDMIGDDFYLYQLNADGSRGTLWYHWVDNTYPTGVNISYYTVKGFFGVWEDVTGTPLDSTGSPHHIAGLQQDARNHLAVVEGQVTFDDETPANGGADDINTVTSNFGLAHGANYRWNINVVGSNISGASFDFRDPVSSDEQFFTSSFYRLRVNGTGGLASIQRYNGSTGGTRYWATQGGAGDYTIETTGASIVLKKGSTTILTVNDGGPQAGVRVRIIPGNAVWSWSGTVLP